MGAGVADTSKGIIAHLYSYTLSLRCVIEHGLSIYGESRWEITLNKQNKTEIARQS
jgi:hypothetical protein